MAGVRVSALAFLAVLRDLLDGDDRDPVVGGELGEEVEPRRCAVVVEHLTDDRDRREPREDAQVDRRLGVAAAFEGAARTGPQREHVARDA